MTETPRLSLRQLSYFVTAAESGSLGAAAEFLGVSPSTLSEAISELEGHLGSQLMLRRKGLGAVLTPFGSEILPQARALLRAAAEIQTSGGGVGRPLTGRLVIGCMSSIAPTVLPPLIVEFGNLHPGVNIEFVEGSQIEIQLALDQGRCEAAILYDDGDLSPMFRREVLYTVEPKIFLSPQHRLSGAEAIGLRDLAGEPFIMVDIPPSRENIKALFRSARVTPNIPPRDRKPGTCPCSGRSRPWLFDHGATASHQYELRRSACNHEPAHRLRFRDHSYIVQLGNPTKPSSGGLFFYLPPVPSTFTCLIVLAWIGDGLRPNSKAFEIESRIHRATVRRR
jgi:DNA-binding transcriptional LysR family regulator